MLVNRVHKPYLCKICKKASGVKVCKCQKAFYCSRSCQKIDWTDHRTDCCFKLVEYPAAQNTTSAINNNSNHIDSPCASNLSSPSVQQHSSNTQIHAENTAAIREGRKEYDPTPLQYQQHNAIYTHNDDCTTAAIDSNAVNDFDENLFNLMSSVVDESTEEEILKNLNIRADDLLSTYSLDTENVATIAPNAHFRSYVPISTLDTDDQLSDKLFDQLQQRDFQPNLVQETKENLEKELSLFRESQQLVNTMQLNTSNPKYVNHTTVQDNITMR